MAWVAQTGITSASADKAAPGPSGLSVLAPTVGIMDFGAAWIGATAAGVVISGAPIMDVATSLSGGAGAAIGYVAGAYGAGYAIWPILGAAIVPGLASGRWDMTVVALAGGAFIGSQAYSIYMKQ